MSDNTSGLGNRDRRFISHSSEEYANKRIGKLEARIAKHSALHPDTQVVNHRGERETAGKRVKLDRSTLERWKSVKDKSAQPEFAFK